MQRARQSLRIYSRSESDARSWPSRVSTTTPCRGYVLHVHRMCTACAPHVHCKLTPPCGPVYAAYILCVRCVCTVCTLHLCAQVDPSALLLHHAACWWAAEARGEGAGHGAEHGCGAPRPPPLWLNDGPVPTAGLLRYKAQYHGALLQVYS